MKPTERAQTFHRLAALLAATAVLVASRPRAQRTSDEAGSAARAPNILLAIADDLDPDHLGFAGNPLARTPNLDRLASAALSFSVLYAQPVCRPALATLLSGRWPHQTGILRNKQTTGLDPAGALPARLRERGYTTYCAGKFWEGDHHAYGFSAPDDLDTSFARYAEGQDELFEFLERNAATGPWFVWWAPSLPHVPHDPPARFRRPFEDAAIPIPKWLSEDEESYATSERALLAMDSWLDDEFARVVAKLEELGERDETLIVFLADNGWSSSLPSKNSPHEKGVRSPLLVAPPGSTHGRRVETRVDLVDVTATLLDYAGAPLNATSPGHSLRPWLEGRAGPVRERLFGVAYDRSLEGAPEDAAYALYARDERWKYILFLRTIGPVKAGQQALYDLAGDPFELHDLAASKVGESGVDQRLAAFRAAALDWWRTTGGKELSALAPR
mgnify:CR=1 FL=1